MLFTHMLIEQGPVIPPARSAQVIYVPEDYDVQFDARRGDTVVVIMYSDGAPVDRCQRMGGETVYNPFTLIYECDGVDF